MDLSQVGRLLLILGLGIALVGVLFVAGSALGLGRLPGDFSWGKGNVRVYVPLASSIVLSVVLTVVLNLLLRR